MLLKAVNEELINTTAAFYASETDNASERPELEIQYYIPQKLSGSAL